MMHAQSKSLQNISYNYLVEAVVDKNKSQIVSSMMDKFFEDVAVKPNVSDTDTEEKVIQQVLLDEMGEEILFKTRLINAMKLNPQVTKKVISQKYGKIIVDHECRKELWITVSKLKILKKQYPDMYYQMLLKSGHFVDKTTEVINLDILRTRGNEVERGMMNRILLAYSRRNNKISYVQGMNFIVRMVLDIGISEEDSFWLFTHIIEECFRVSYFTDLNNLMLEALVFRIVLKAVEPRVAVHLEGFKDLQFDMIVLKWFLTLFADSNIGVQYLNRIWDLLLLGESMLFAKSAYVVIQELAPKILKCSEEAQLHELFKNLGDNFRPEPDAFLAKVGRFFVCERMFETLRIANQVKLQKLKKQLGEKVSLEKRNEDEIRRIAKKGVCDGKTATCQSRDLSEVSTEFLTFTSKGIIKNQIHNYFSTENSFWQENKRKKGLKFREKDLVVYREMHTCPAAIMGRQYDNYVRSLVLDSPAITTPSLKRVSDQPEDDLSLEPHCDGTEAEGGRRVGV